MSVINEYTRAIDAAQRDRQAAFDAGDNAADMAIFEALVTPINQARARLVLAPPDDQTALQALSALLDGGLASLAGRVNAAFLAHSTSCADDVRAQAGIAAAPRLRRPEGLPVVPPAPALDEPTPVASEAPTGFIAARRAAARIIVFTDAQGHEFTREGGSRSWRNCNPGNIIKGLFAETNGAIGDDGAFAIFPDEKTGFDAIVTLLRGRSYGPLTLEGALNRYAPPSENDTGAYLRFVSTETSITADTVLDDLRIAAIRSIARAIQKMEGWTPGSAGPRTPASAAVIAPQPAARGVPGTGLVRPGITTAARSAQEWMDIAHGEAALPERERSEWPDPEENPRIVRYLKQTASWLDASDEIDWCAAFANWCLENAGYVGTSHPGARSFYWNKQSQFIALDQPAYGAVAVRRYSPFSDRKWKTGAGHVGFVISHTDTTVRLLGGNQGRTVKEADYARITHDAAGNVTSQFVAFMMPVMN